MRSFLRLAIGVTAMFLCVLAFPAAPGGQTREPVGNYGVGIPKVFLSKYLAFRTAQLSSGAPDVVRIPLGYVKGISTAFTSMTGDMTVNLRTGAFTVSLNRLSPQRTYSLWLIDRSESESLLPAPDATFGLASFVATSTTGRVGPARWI